VGSTLLVPASAVNEYGENLLPYISELDGVFTPGYNGVTSPAWNDLHWNVLTLDLGDLSGAENVKLVINGMVDWGPADEYYVWIDQFKEAAANGLITSDTEVTPAPYLEVKNAAGEWVRVTDSVQMPIPADYVARSFVVDLSQLFPVGTTDYSLRLCNFWNVTFDYIGVDITPQADIDIQTIEPTAELYSVETSISAAAGNFTRYGDVTELLSAADNMYVIGRQGDEVHLLFPVDNLAPVADGMERDIFLFASSWFKDCEGNWGFMFDFTVDPLPFEGMSGFPYPTTESYPYDQAHLDYLQQYNTRFIHAPVVEKSYMLPWIAGAAAAIVAVDLTILLFYKKRRSAQ